MPLPCDIPRGDSGGGFCIVLMFSQATGSLILFLMVANGDLDPVLFIFGVAVPLQFC